MTPYPFVSKMHLQKSPPPIPQKQHFEGYGGGKDRARFLSGPCIHLDPLDVGSATLVNGIP